jgi:hypothetical protein
MFICTKPRVTLYEWSPGILALMATRHFSIAPWPGFCYSDAVALGAQLPARPGPDTESGLETIAQRTGTTQPALIRLLSKRFVDPCVSEDATVTMPPNTPAMLNARDSRSGLPAARPSGPVKYKIPRRKKDRP